MSDLTAHPRLSVNSICSMNQSLDQDLALWADLGIDNVGLISPKLDAAWDVSQQAVLDAKLVVSSMSAYPHGIVESLPFTAAVGCDVLYTVSGSFGAVLFEEAAEKFCQEMTPIVAQAQDFGVRLAVEPTNPFRSAVSFVYCLRDAIDLARKVAGLGVVVDFYSCWYERNLEELVRQNIDLVALVQIGDYRLGTFDIPNRCALGDGDIPVERLFGLLLDAGYEGPFDLEILGPEIEEEGYRAPIVRSVERASEILDRLGA